MNEQFLLSNIASAAVKIKSQYHELAFDLPASNFIYIKRNPKLDLSDQENHAILRAPEIHCNSTDISFEPTPINSTNTILNEIEGGIIPQLESVE